MVKKAREFWMNRESLDSALSSCDLGDSYGASVTQYPHRDSLEYLVKVREVVPVEVDEDLEVAARAHSFHDKESIFQLASSQECPRLDSFKAGAEWQKAKDATWIKEFERRAEHYRSEFLKEYDKNVGYVVSSQAKAREKTIREVVEWLSGEAGNYCACQNAPDYLMCRKHAMTFCTSEIESKFLPKESG